ncbi:MAG: TonB-dependent receptor [Bacteroidota bacterium]
MGTSGNQSGIGDFGSLSLFTLGASYNGNAGILQAQPSNPNLGWETVQSFNAGLEYSVLKGRISGTAEFYINNTIDMLLPTQLSRTSGFSSITQNIGAMRNTGVELDISANIFKIQGFEWNVNANFTYNKNEITKLVDGDEIINGLTIVKIGYPAATNYVVPLRGRKSGERRCALC